MNQEFEYHVMRFIVGQRPYLHDDLRAFKLSIALIAEPPLELWPEVMARVSLPDDVLENVIRPMHDSWLQETS